MTRFSTSVATVVVLATAVGAQQRPDFSGTWVVEDDRGSGLGALAGSGVTMGPSPSELLIVQSATLLNIEQTGRISKVIYRLDGVETKGEMPASGSTTRPATFRSVWKGDRLVTTIVTRAEQGGSVTMEEVRYLDKDDFLVVETSIPGQPSLRRTVYRRKA